MTQPALTTPAEIELPKDQKQYVCACGEWARVLHWAGDAYEPLCSRCQRKAN